MESWHGTQNVLQVPGAHGSLEAEGFAGGCQCSQGKGFLVEK